MLDTGKLSLGCQLGSAWRFRAGALIAGQEAVHPSERGQHYKRTELSKEILTALWSLGLLGHGAHGICFGLQGTAAFQCLAGTPAW